MMTDGASSISAAHTTESEQARVVRQILASHCIAALRNIQNDHPDKGLWDPDSIRTMTAILELQRGEPQRGLFHFETIDNYWILRVIDVLTTRSYFNIDNSGERLLLDLQSHLRLLAASFHLYKTSGGGMNQALYDQVYDGISNEFWKVFTWERDRRSENVRVEDYDVEFLIKHCQYLLLSIDESDSLGTKLGKKAVIGFDLAMAILAKEVQDVRPGASRLLKHKRSRPKWHREFAEIEDAVYMYFATDVYRRCSGTNVDVEDLIQDAKDTISLIGNTLDWNLDPIAIGKNYKLRNCFVRHAVGKTSSAIGDAGPYEESGVWFQYGLLDLLSQLTVRLRGQARERCFPEIVCIVRMALERSPQSAIRLHRKATDLWNRIEYFEKNKHGDPDDREFIRNWIKQNNKLGENKTFSIKYSLSK
jgi:hypothetical protein